MLFWYEVWIGNEPFKLSFPRLFKHTTNQMAFVASMGVWDRNEWRWCFTLARALITRDVDERNLLQKMLEAKRLISSLMV